MFQRHYSDERLLSYLDGELPARTAEAVKQHLEQCWSCRRRAGELEDTLRSLSKTVDEVNYPGPLWVAETGLRIAERQREIDRDLASVPKLGILRGGLRSRLLVPAVCLASVLLAVAIWQYGQHASEPTAIEVIALAQTAEVEIHQQPTRQVFRVEFTQVHPEPKQYSRRLEIWSDPTAERSAARWRGPAGDLKYAVYRPERGRGYIYDPAVTPTAVLEADRSAKLVSVTEIGENGHQVEQLEAEFVKWLEGRQWQPLALVPGLASFASQDGAVLALEQIRLPVGEDVLRVTAQRVDEDLSVELLLEVDSREYRPRLLRLRFETPRRVVHVRVIPEEHRQVAAARLPVAIFEPDYPQHIPTEPMAANRLPALTPTEAPAPDTPPRPLPSELLATEVEARYALHRVGAFLGDPIKIARSCTNVHVSGVVSTPERKNQLVAALAEMEENPWLIHDLQTIDEVLASEELSQDPSFEPDHEGTRDERGVTDDLAVLIPGHRLPLEDHLKRYFRANRKSAEGSSDELDENVRRLAAEAVALSGDTLAEAWALRRLAASTRKDWIRRLPPRSRWLLEAMFRDYLNEIHAKAGQLHKLIEPALSEIADSAGVGNADRTANPADKASVPIVGTDILEVFGAVEEIRSQVLSLFADGGPTLETQNAEASDRVRLRSPEQTARLLLGMLARVEAETRRLGRLSPLDFAQDAAIASVPDPCGWDDAPH